MRLSKKNYLSPVIRESDPTMGENRKRICFVVDSIFSIGGVQRVTAVMARELAATYDVTIVTFDRPEAMDLSLYGLAHAPIRYRFLAYPAVGRVTRLLCKAYSALYLSWQPRSGWASDLYARSSFPRPLRKALAKELRSGHYQVIIGVHAPLAARLATLRSELPDTRLMGWLHNSYQALFGNSSVYIGAKRKRHYVYQFRKLDEVVVLCHDDARQFNQYDGAFRPRVIYNPLTLTPGALADGTTRRFLTIGRFTHLHKGIDLLIEAFRAFAPHHPDWTLDIVGEGVEGERYQHMIEQYRLQEQVRIHPFTHHVQEYYSQAQVYVLSSRWEGMPLVLVEAMSHGLPVVASDLPVCQEILGDLALYFRNGDLEELAKRLEEATRMDWPAKSSEALGLARRFDVGRIVEQWRRLIEGSA